MISILIAAETAAFAPLPLLVIVPFITVGLLLLLPANRPDYHKIVALAGSVITGAISFYLLKIFELGEGGFQFVVSRTMISDLGINWTFGVDGISLFLIVLTGILFPIAIAAIDPHHDSKAYYI